MTRRGCTTEPASDLVADLVIVGGGAAGLFCAREAALAGKTGSGILVLEKQASVGRKLLMSGGGKANCTNRSVTVADYIGEDPRFTRRALAAFPPERLTALLEEAGIPLEERDHGRLFCRKTAGDILDFLRPRAGCRVETDTMATAVSRLPERGFLLQARSGENERTITARRLVLATGSPAWPASGADASGLSLARSLGHRILPPRPVLTPFILPPESPLTTLAGIAVPVLARCELPDSPVDGVASVIDDALLFTHKGLSGPAALQLSCFWRKETALVVDFLPGKDAAALLDAPSSGKLTPRTLFSRLLPERLVRALFVQAALPEALWGRKIAELSRKDRDALRRAVQSCRVTPQRTAGLGQAEACAGGVDTAEVDPRRMESRLAPGLFFCGEILDVAGRLGGYNLHWAWASAFMAARAAGGGPQKL